jgi:hypothetical protein
MTDKTDAQFIKCEPPQEKPEFVSPPPPRKDRGDPIPGDLCDLLRERANEARQQVRTEIASRILSGLLSQVSIPPVEGLGYRIDHIDDGLPRFAVDLTDRLLAELDKPVKCQGDKNDE